MKRLTNGIFLLLCLLSPILSAQSNPPYTAEWLAEFKTGRSSFPNQHITSTEDGHYMLYTEPDQQLATSVIKFDNNLAPTDQQIKLFQGIPSAMVLGVYAIDGKLLSIGTTVTEKYRKYYSQSIDLANWQVSAPKQIIHINAPSDRDLRRTYFSFLRSQDGGSVGLFYERPVGRKEMAQYELIVFDGGFDIISQHRYTFPYQQNSFSIVEGMLTNDQEMIVLSVEGKTNKAFGSVDDRRAFRYQLSALQNGTSTPIAKLPNNSRLINSTKLSVTDSTIRVMGFYSNKEQYAIRGTYFHQINRLDSTRNIHQFNPLENGTLEAHREYTPKRQLRNGELPYYVHRGTYTYADGSVLLLAEQTYTVSNNYVMTYYRQNIFATLLRSDGTTDWTQVIKKDNTKMSSPRFSGFAYSNQTDRCIMVYNGNPSNLSRHVNGRTKVTWGNHALLLAEITKDGELSQYALSNAALSDDYVILPALGSRVGDQELLFMAQQRGKKKKRRFVRVLMEE